MCTDLRNNDSEHADVAAGTLFAVPDCAEAVAYWAPTIIHCSGLANGSNPTLA